MNKNRLLLTATLALATSTLHAALITETTRVFTVGYDIADLQDPPAVFLQTITDSAIVSLTEVRVSLHLVGRDGGGFASEMFVSLNRDLGPTSVLLNGVGISGSDPLGASYNGWNVSFSDNAAGGDIHNALPLSDILTGDFQPDGRADPADAARNALLEVFLGGSGNGDWRLGVADLGLGGTMRLESWSLTLSGVTEIPEPSTWAGCGAIASFALAQWIRSRRRKSS